MTHDAQPSGGASATTSVAGSEAAYLARQSDEAQAAIRRALDDLRANVRGGLHQAADLRAWVDRHPWVVMGAASAAGFAAAIALLPAAGESVREKWSRTFSGLTGTHATEPAATNGHAAPPARESRAALMGMVLGPLIDVLKVALENYLIAMMAKQAAPPPDGEPGVAANSDVSADAPASTG